MTPNPTSPLTPTLSPSGARGTLALYAVLLTGALAVALITRQRGAGQSPVPSIENPGAAGLKALSLYLGDRAQAWRAPLTELGSDVKVLVIAAPTQRNITADEIDALEHFVKRGGTLLYLAPRGHQQARMAEWLSLSRGAFPPVQALPGNVDLLGATSEVAVPVGLARGLHALRTSGSEGVNVDRADAIPIASHGALWRIAMGNGEIWIGSGADLAENRRLELADNLALWENAAARGRIAFDEDHFAAAPQPPVSVAMLAFGAQFFACGLFFAFARGQRLGPPRPDPESKDRSTLEYLASLAQLMRASKLERDLIADLAARLRALMHERLGISTGLSERDAAFELAKQAPISAGELLALFDDARRAAPTPREYARLARQFARVERVITGRESAPPLPLGEG